MFKKLVFKAMEWSTALIETHGDNEKQMRNAVLKKLFLWLPLLLVFSLLCTAGYLWIIIAAYTAWGFLPTLFVFWLLLVLLNALNKLLPQYIVKQAEPYIEEWCENHEGELEKKWEEDLKRRYG